MIRGWRPTPMIRASLLAHAAAPLLVAARPEAWAAVLAGVALNHAILGLFGLWPSSQLVGKTVRRLPGAVAGRVALTFDDGPDPLVTPAVLALLEQHDARATFFCIGERAARHPGLIRAIHAGGHAVGNHTMHHPPGFATRGIGGQRREIAAAQAVLSSLGPAPSLFRAPLGLRSPLLDPVLHEQGLAHVSWSRRGYDTSCAEPTVVLRRLSTGLTAGEILLLHDGNAARMADGTPVVLPVLRELLPLLGAQGLRAVTVDPPAPALAATGAKPAMAVATEIRT